MEWDEILWRPSTERFGRREDPAWQTQWFTWRGWVCIARRPFGMHGVVCGLRSALAASTGERRPTPSCSDLRLETCGKQHFRTALTRVRQGSKLDILVCSACVAI